MKKTFQYTIIGLLIAFASWGVCSLLYFSHPGKLLELKGLDYLFYLRGTVPAPGDIVIVAIDEPSFAELKLSWPWPRKVHTELIDNLNSAGAKVIAYDILFADSKNEEDDSMLAESIERRENVILSSDLNIVDEHGYKQVVVTEPIPVLRKAAKGVGVTTLIYDPDNFVRRCKLEFNSSKSFIYEILKLHEFKNYPPLSEDILINYIGPPRSIKTVSFYQALKYKEYLPHDIFENKIVFVGRSLLASPDPMKRQAGMFATPFYKAQMSGPEVLANFLDTILKNRYIKKPDQRFYLSLFLVLLLILSVILVRTGYIPGLLLSLVLIVVYAGITIWLFSYYSILIPVFVPVLGLVFLYGAINLFKYFIIEQEEKYIKKAFAKYVAPAVVKQLLEQPDKLKLGGNRITGTVLYSDLAGFSTISEKFSPEELVLLINEYLAVVTDAVFSEHGTVMRYIGDAVLAVWGAPVWHKDHAIRACRTAVKMQDKVKQLNIEWKRRNLPKLRVRIGISTGKMVVGNMGSRGHFDYAAMGDSVNLGARLQEANKFYSTSILINKPCADILENRFTLRTLDKVMVRGKEEHLLVYELINVKGKTSQEQEEFIAVYEKGLSAEWNKNWNEAVSLFKKALEIAPNDTVSKIHLERCAEYQKHPPLNDWDGVFVLK